MRRAKIMYPTLGALLRSGRLAAEMDATTAAAMIGINSNTYLVACEMGRINFPFQFLKRAMEVYGIDREKAIKVILEDYKQGISEALK